MAKKQNEVLNFEAQQPTIAEAMAGQKETAIEQVDTELAELPPEIIESLMVTGDLSKLTVEQRNAYYVHTCKKIGLDPTGQPFEYITFQGKTILYARKGCAEQLRKIHGISIINITYNTVNGMYVCSCTVKDIHGRTDTGIGACPIGKEPHNALMKAETKAKRRATLSICGLGFIEESHPSEHQEKELPECKSKVLLEDTMPEGEAKKNFAEVVKYRIGQNNVPAGVFVALLAQSQRLSGLKDIDKCAKWLMENAEIEVERNDKEEIVTAALKEYKNG